VGHIEYPYFGHNPDWLGSLALFQSGGGLGVAIFFVISGYLIAQSRWIETSFLQSRSTSSRGTLGPTTNRGRKRRACSAFALIQRNRMNC